MSLKNTLSNLKKIFNQAMSQGDHRLALQAQIAIAKYYAESKKPKTCPTKKTTFDIEQLSEAELIKLIQDISKKIQYIPNAT
jgi:hypothetical protein